MNIFRKIKEKWDDWYYHDIDDGDFEDDYPEFSGEDSEGEMQENRGGKSKDSMYYIGPEPVKYERVLKDSDQRTVYILECLEQMTEAGMRMEQAADEYEAVTSLLVDMEEIEHLPPDIRGMIVEQAQKVSFLEEERRKLYPKTGQLSDATIQKMERLENEIPGGIKKMQEAEDYRRLIKQDLRKLSADRKNCNYQKRELSAVLVNSRGITLIIVAAMIMCMIILAILQFSFEMDVRVGYMIAGGAGAIALTFLYIRHMEAGIEIEKVHKKLNKLISLQNTVKIRYVNNTNLLSYLYMKYGVEDSSELEELWEIFVEEMSARGKDEKLREDLEYYYEKLADMLKRYRIKDADIWTHQCKALIDHGELVEVRHALVARRKKLRDQMEYNKKIINNSKNMIGIIKKKFPQYADEVDKLVSQYSPKG